MRSSVFFLEKEEQEAVYEIFDVWVVKEVNLFTFSDQTTSIKSFRSWLCQKLKYNSNQNNFIHTQMYACNYDNCTLVLEALFKNYVNLNR